MKLREIIYCTMRYRERDDGVMYLHGALDRVVGSFNPSACYTDPMILDWIEERLFHEEELTWCVGFA